MKQIYDKPISTDPNYQIVYNEKRIEKMEEEIARIKNKRATKSTPFIIKELEGRIKALKAYPKAHFEFTKGQYAPFDAYVKSEDRPEVIKTIVEIKDRNIPSTEYYDAQLELHKVSKMVDIAKSRGISNVIYMAHYTDNKTAIWDLKKYVDTTPVTFYSPYQTVGDSQMILKQMILLPLKEAKIVERTI